MTRAFPRDSRASVVSFRLTSRTPAFSPATSQSTAVCSRRPSTPWGGRWLFPAPPQKVADRSFDIGAADQGDRFTVTQAKRDERPVKEAAVGFGASSASD